MKDDRFERLKFEIKREMQTYCYHNFTDENNEYCHALKVVLHMIEKMEENK